MDNNNAVQRDNPVIAVRSRLLRALFTRLAIAYSYFLQPCLRQALEYCVLGTAIMCTVLLVYMHLCLTRHPPRCLEHVRQSWPRDGILRVDVMRNYSLWYHLNDSYRREYMGFDYEKLYQLKHDWNPQNLEEAVEELQTIAGNWIASDNRYIMEYSLEYGFLRLSPPARQRLNIEVMLVVLDPNVDKCFGNAFNVFVLEELLGYDDILLSSIKDLAEGPHTTKGFMRNIGNGGLYRFVSRTMSYYSYFTAVFAMMFFTMSISILLRFSQQQLFTFIMYIIQLDIHASILFLIAPLLAVLLSLVGMEGIMAEFFANASTPFYVIMMVWICDQYDSVCCHTDISKRHWLRFFYLYHTAFYLYHYRFHGQLGGLALVTCWLFTLHSMLFFLHRYELPLVLHAHRVQQGLIDDDWSSDDDDGDDDDEDDGDEAELADESDWGGYFFGHRIIYHAIDDDDDDENDV